MVATTRFVLGSMRCTAPGADVRGAPVFVIQTAPKPNTAANEFGATLICATI